MEIRRAAAADLDGLVEVMEFHYRDEGEPLGEGHARRAVAGLLSDERSGRIWVLADGARVVGYLALTFGYSLELGGRDAFIDELYLLADWRGRGYGTRMIEMALAAAEEAGVVAVHLEVAPENEGAESLYARLGFEMRRYRLMIWRGGVRG